jgi:hypothetical protein
MVRSADVLAQLDAAQRDFLFPDLGHGYAFTIDCRLQAFGDGARWALVVEVVGYQPRAANVYDVLHYFGNCLTSGGPGYEEEDFVPRIDNMDQVEDRDHPEVFTGGTVRVRGQGLRVDAAPGAELAAVFRCLVPEYRDLLLATETELRRRIPGDLPRLMQLQEWHQPDLFHALPSNAEVYAQLADVLATADPRRYRPSQTPNTHWSNWPDSGAL